MKASSTLLLLGLLTGCAGTPPADLAYLPTVALAPQSAHGVASVTVTDARDEPDPTFIGSIRGGYGNPLKTLTSAQPAKDEVAAAFVAALRSRGLYGPEGRGSLAITLTELSANQVARREGHTTFSLTLTDRDSGAVLFRDREDVLKVSGSIITFDAGIFASVEDLRAITALSLSTAIDQALAKPDFLAAMAKPAQ